MENEQQKHKLTEEEKAIVYRKKKNEYSGRPLNPDSQYDLLVKKYPEQVKEYRNSLPSYFPRK